MSTFLIVLHDGALGMIGIGILYAILGTISWIRERSSPPPISRFSPCANYQRELDQLCYLTEDVSYRADHFDEYISLLWHPYEWVLVGIQIHGFSEWVYDIHPENPLHLKQLIQRIQSALEKHLRPDEVTFRIYRLVEGWCGEDAFLLNAGTRR